MIGARGGPPPRPIFFTNTYPISGQKIFLKIFAILTPPYIDFNSIPSFTLVTLTGVKEGCGAHTCSGDRSTCRVCAPINAPASALPRRRQYSPFAISFFSPDSVAMWLAVWLCDFHVTALRGINLCLNFCARSKEVSSLVSRDVILRVFEMFIFFQKKKNEKKKGA